MKTGKRNDTQKSKKRSKQIEKRNGSHRVKKQPPPIIIQIKFCGVKLNSFFSPHSPAFQPLPYLLDVY